RILFIHRVCALKKVQGGEHGRYREKEAGSQEEARCQEEARRQEGSGQEACGQEEAGRQEEDRQEEVSTATQARPQRQASRLTQQRQTYASPSLTQHPLESLTVRQQ